MLEYLFQEIEINGLRIKNRILMPAMHLGYLKDGMVNDRFVRYYEVRARGGAGIIFVGVCDTRPDGGEGNTSLCIGHERFFSGLSRLAEAVKKNGARVGIQLSPNVPVGKAPDISGIPLEAVEEMIEGCAQAARRAEELGFDAVEFLGSGSGIISQFMSPLSNRRDDQFGGDFENRARFPAEIIRMARGAVREDFPLFIRIHGDEFLPGGYTLDEARRFARRFEEEGVNAINVTGGGHHTKVPQITMNVPRGAYSYLARGIKEAVGVPVIASNRINDPALANDILRDGLADMISFGRGLNADPDLPRKAMEGRLNEINRCIACNEGCLDRIFAGQMCTCLVNPQAGMEEEWEIKPAPNPKRVMVIGGGPAGMEAAAVMAGRGHQVLIYEKEGDYGGLMNLAAIPPGREEFITFRDYLVNRLRRLHVEVVTGVKVTPDLVAEEAPDVVVLATGPKRRVPDVPGIDSPHVVHAEDVLTGKAHVGRRVAIIGGGGVGCETALFLARRGGVSAEAFLFLCLNNAIPQNESTRLVSSGREITVLRRGKRIGEGMGRSTRWVILQEMRALGVREITQVSYRGIREDGVLIEVGGEERLVEADTVVIAAGYDADDEMEKMLREKVKEVHLVGNARAAGNALQAVRDAFETALEI